MKKVSGEETARELRTYEGTRVPQDEVETLFGFRVHTSPMVAPGAAILMGQLTIRVPRYGTFRDAGIDPALSEIIPVEFER